MTENVLLLQYAEQTEPPRLLIACLRPVALCFLRKGVFCIIFY